MTREPDHAGGKRRVRCGGNVILPIGQPRIGIESGTQFDGEFPADFVSPGRRNDIHGPWGLTRIIQDLRLQFVSPLDHAADRAALMAAPGEVEPVAGNSIRGGFHENPCQWRCDEQGKRLGPRRVAVIGDRSEMEPDRGETAEPVEGCEGELPLRMNRDASRVYGADPESLMGTKLLRGLGLHEVFQPATAAQMDEERSLDRQ